ncbi:L-threonylcarbamoyladenylate synthase [Parvularcula oceani]|uniref:L-threonylcarbamoyladenylate synthase n=1 Tax=Parvularcula oceani TaxID=1247963 RepID=UPI0004E1D31F|nr:L-threonylcarbamoyladenylate synthase [Parvularcula oceani]
MSEIWPANEEGIGRAASRLESGGLVGVPTETVYGLAADAANGEAVARIFETKGRPAFNPLILHVRDLEQARRFGHFGDAARQLAERFWPGPLTLVVPLDEGAPLALLATAGLGTVGLRSPAHQATQELLRGFGRPFVAPSANRSGRISPTRAEHVTSEFAGQVPVLDGGPCPGGIESTIVGFAEDGPALLRPGGIAAEEIEAVLGARLAGAGPGIQAPGMTASHYAPRGQVRLNAGAAQAGEALLGFGGTAGAALDLSPSGDLREAAANLFDYLRRLDAEDADIAVAPIPESGLGRAINDRLRRAAAPR